MVDLQVKSWNKPGISATGVLWDECWWPFFGLGSFRGLWRDLGCHKHGPCCIPYTYYHHSHLVDGLLWPSASLVFESQHPLESTLWPCPEMCLQTCGPRIRRGLQLAFWITNNSLWSDVLTLGILLVELDGNGSLWVRLQEPDPVSNHTVNSQRTAQK